MQNNARFLITHAQGMKQFINSYRRLKQPPRRWVTCVDVNPEMRRQLLGLPSTDPQRKAYEWYFDTLVQGERALRENNLVIWMLGGGCACWASEFLDSCMEAVAAAGGRSYEIKRSLWYVLHRDLLTVRIPGIKQARRLQSLSRLVGDA